MEAFFTVVFGLCFGSFLNVVIYRTPINKSVVLPSSSCFKCGKKLKFYHNIPLISYLFLNGRCAFCKVSIPITYPLVEFASSVFSYLVYLKLGFSLVSLLFSITLLLFFALSIIDYKFQEVPDSINLSALLFGILGGMLHNNFVATMICACAFAGFFTLLRFVLENILRKDVLGEGDIIVVATMGAILGFKLTLVAIFLSSCFALVLLLVIKGKDIKVAFIPFLLLGTSVSFFFDNYFFILPDCCS